MILHSPRIDIKPLTKKELQLFLKSRTDYEKHAGLRVTDFDLSENYCEELLETIDRLPNVWDKGKSEYLFYTLWLMIERESKTIIGQFTFNGQPNGKGEVEIFFSIESQFRRNGYATEVMETILCWGGKTQLFRLVVVDVDLDNKAAMGSLKKLGFRKVENEEEVSNEISVKYYKVVCQKSMDCEELDFDI
jgi:ribosomal-protein-alanine N-acetyltransferase